MKRKGWIVILMAMCISALCTACRSSKGTGNILYNLSDRFSAETEKYIIYSYTEDPEENIIYILDKDSGEQNKLARNPLSSNKGMDRCVFSDGDNAYYIEYEYESERSGEMKKMLVHKVELENFEDTVIYEVSIDEGMDSYLGIYDKTISNKYTVWIGFCVVGNQLVLIFQDEVRTVNLLTGKWELLIQDYISSLACDGEYLYYASSDYEINRVHLENSECDTLEDIVTHSFIIMNDTLYFINLRDVNKLYAYALNGTSSPIQVVEDHVETFKVDNEYIYYTVSGRDGIYRAEVTGGESEIFYDMPVVTYYVYSQYVKVMLLEGMSYDIVDVDKQTKTIIGE